MATDGNPPAGPEGQGNGNDNAGRVLLVPIENELRDAYLTYSMSVIISRALPDVRDGLKPSQRRILVAMNDLNLRPGSGRVKCAKISGDTSGNYHPHGEAVIYPTLVRMAQEWNMRHVLIDKQGNFGSIAGLPPAAMRYTEARLSPAAALLLDDLDLDTVDFVPTYDERRTEPVVLPSKFPNLLVNGANGIAVAMTTSIPPHNLGEICRALVHLIDTPGATIDELLEIAPGPDFPTGGIICGRAGIRRGYHTGGGSVVVRARADIEDTDKRARIVISEIPFQATRDRVMEKIGDMIKDERIKGVHDLRDESSLEQPVRIVLDMKKDVDPHVILNQLYHTGPLQDTFSLTFVALVDGKPRRLNFKELLQEFLRHRVTVIRRRTQYLLEKARRRKHTVEGLLLAFANIDEIIRIIRSSSTQAEAKQRLQGVAAPAAMMQRALGDEGFAVFQNERGVASEYFLTPVQAEAILRMTLGQLVNLEQEKLGGEYNSLLEEINEYLRILGDESVIYDMIRTDLEDIARKHSDKRRTEISGEELGHVDIGDLIEEETMVVTISHRGYIKRTPSKTYRAQRRGGKGLKGAAVAEEDPIEHLFVASTHDYLLFFTNRGRVQWQKVYDLPALSRESKGRAIVNLLQLQPGEQIANCLAIRDFSEANRFLLMATREGLVKKTPLEAYSRPLRGGIIAIKLREGDELVGVTVCSDEDEVVLSTAQGMAIRFPTSDARPMGRNTSGVKGIKLSKDDSVVGMVIAEPEATLLAVCAHGHGKRTPFGYSTRSEAEALEAPADDTEVTDDVVEDIDDVAEENGDDEAGGDESTSGSRRYRTQRRGGKGLRDIKTSKRNGPVVATVSVVEDDEVLMITAGGKLQRIAVAEISVLGRNTQGVRIMNIDSEDTLAAVVTVPREEDVDAEPAPTNGETEVTSEAVVDSSNVQALTDESNSDGEPAADDETSSEDE